MLQRALLQDVIAGLVRRSWLVTIATVIACAGFAANAVAALVEARYLAPRGASPLASGPRVAPPKPIVRPDAGVIIARNVFCSTCTPVDGPDPADGFSPRGTLIATEIGERARRATIVVAPDVFGAWEVGADVPRVGRIVAIDRTSVTIEDARGRRGRLVLDRAATRDPEPPASPPSPWSDRVRALDDHTFEVDRTLVRDLVGGGAKPGGMRVVPAGEHGGLRLAGVQAGSLAAAFGLKSGDVLSALDGEPIASYQMLIDFYEKLDRVSVVRLAGTRGDRPFAIELRLI